MSKAQPHRRVSTEPCQSWVPPCHPQSTSTPWLQVAVALALAVAVARPCAPGLCRVGTARRKVKVSLRLARCSQRLARRDLEDQPTHPLPLAENARQHHEHASKHASDRKLQYQVEEHQDVIKEVEAICFLLQFDLRMNGNDVGSEESLAEVELLPLPRHGRPNRSQGLHGRDRAC